jgi:NAD(P)-dependent dehydrogenase (short-subunit alcohol dehydrogenase family)
VSIASTISKVRTLDGLLGGRVDLNGHRVLITGAARGIGAELARQLASQGAKVALIGLEPAALKAVADEIGPSAVWAEADVRDIESLAWAFEKVAEVFGGIDTVVANAGVASYGTVATTDPVEFARTIDINLLGVFRTMHTAIPYLQQGKNGFFLTMSSLAGLSPVPGMSAYGASKAGVESLGHALRYEGHHRGIRSGVVYPSWIDTDMVRDIARDLDTFRNLRDKLPYPANATTTVEICAATIVRTIQRRQRQTYIPGAVRALRLLKPALVMKPIIVMADKRRALDSIDALEAEIIAKGQTTSDPLRMAEKASSGS